MNFQAFFETYYREIIAGAIAIAYLVTSLLVCRKGRRLEKFSLILQSLPDLVATANEVLGSGTGPAKLVYVLSMCRDLCTSCKIDFDRDFFVEEIEKILAADKQQKKEVSYETRKSTSSQRPQSFLFDGKQDKGD